jgi:hypothetical protein
MRFYELPLASANGQELYPPLGFSPMNAILLKYFNNLLFVKPMDANISSGLCPLLIILQTFWN